MSAQIVFPELLKECLAGDAPDLTDKVEVVLLMSNNNAADTPSATTTADITLDAIASGTQDAYLKVVKDGASRRAYLQPCQSDMTTAVTLITFNSLAAGARDVKGMLWRCKSDHPTHALLPIAYKDFTTARAANGENFKVTVGKILLTSGS